MSQAAPSFCHCWKMWCNFQGGAANQSGPSAECMCVIYDISQTLRSTLAPPAPPPPNSSHCIFTPCPLRNKFLLSSFLWGPQLFLTMGKTLGLVPHVTWHEHRMNRRNVIFSEGKKNRLFFANQFDSAKGLLIRPICLGRSHWPKKGKKKKTQLGAGRSFQSLEQTTQMCFLTALFKPF